MKKYITLAALLAAGTTFANAETITPLTSAEDWTHISLRNRATWTLDTDAGTLVLNNSNWGQAVSTYDFDAANISSFDFSVDITRGNASAGVTFVLIGSDKAIAVGTKYYTNGALYYGTSDTVDAESYYLNTAWDSGVAPTATQLLADALNYDATLSLEGKTSVNESGETILSLSATSTSAGTNEGTVDINLGKNFTLDKIMLCGDGDESGVFWTVSNLSVSIPEPSAFGLLAGVGALALVASRRRRR